MKKPRLPPALRRHLRTILGLWPLRPAGLVIAALGWYAWSREGQQHADYVLYSAGLVAVGLVAVCLLFTLLGLAVLALDVRKRASMEHRVTGAIDTGQPLATGFTWSRLSLWPLLGTTMSWDDPEAVEVTVAPSGWWRLAETVRFRRRGHVERIVRRFVVEDIFGLTRMSFPRSWPASLRVLPARSPVDPEAARRAVGGDGWAWPSGEPVGDLVEMRRYAPGDSMRHVLWKTYARTRRLLVRTPERALVELPDPVGFLIAGPGDEPAASLARTFFESGLLGRNFVFAADGATEPARDAEAALELVVGSAALDARRSGEGLASLLSRVDRSQLGNCVIFVPNARAAGPWLDRLQAFCRQVPTPPTCVVGVDLALSAPSASRFALGTSPWSGEDLGGPAASQTPPQTGGDVREADRGGGGGRIKRLFVAPPPPPTVRTVAPREVRALHDSLTRLGAEVRVLDRGTGRLLTPDTLDRLERL